MKRIFRLTILCCLLLALLGQPAPASAQLPQYLHREIMYTPVDFQPSNSALTYYRGFNKLYPYIVQPGGSLFTMPLILPRGADVEAVTMYYEDSTPNGKVRLEWMEYDPDTNTSRSIFYMESENREPDVVHYKKTTLASPEPIDSSRAQQIRVTFDISDSLVAFHGVRVQYRMPLIVIGPDPETTFTVAGMDFSPARTDMQYAPVGYGLNLTQAPPSGSPSFFFPLDLPVGAELKEVKVYYIDRGSANLVVSLDGINPKIHLDTAYSTHNTGGLPSDDAIRSLSLAVTTTPIHTGKVRYRISYHPSAATTDLVLVAARVRYTGGESRGLKVKTYMGMELRPSNSNIGYTSQLGGLVPLNAVWYNYYSANLRLPDNRKVSKITFFYKDNHHPDNVKTTVMTYEPATDTNDYNLPFEWDSGSQGDPSPDAREIGGMPDIQGTLDTANRSYQAWVTFDGDAELVLYGMQVEYFQPYPTYLPGLQRE